MLSEFKKFALKGNMIDLAVGVIIGGAFNGIVTSLVNDMIMPLLSLLTQRIDFTNLFIALDGGNYPSLELAKQQAVPTLNYGLFISKVIHFLIMAFVVFLLVKWINKLKKTESNETNKSDTNQSQDTKTKKCPRCITDINIKATKCPHCTADVEETNDKQQENG